MKKILIISTTFFPDPQVPAIRMTQWCRHLPQFGWKPHVLCRYYGYEASPAELAAQVHPDVTVEYLEKPAAGGSKSRCARCLTGAGYWFRRLGISFIANQNFNTLFVPDPGLIFWRLQRANILKRVREIQPDVILTTSPPHSNHDIGLWLAAETGIPWVADFRDPHLLDNRFRPRGLGLLRWQAHRRFKAAIYNRAWLIIHAIPNMARHSRRHYLGARARMLQLTNAFPPEMLTTLADSPRAEQRKTVLVAGTIPEPEQLRLARVVAQLVAEGYDLQLKLLGKRPVCEPQLRAALGERLVLPGYVPHTESIRAVAEADVLVNFLDVFRSQSRSLSTKLFEYLASGKPVLCINPSRVDRLFLWRMSGVRVLIRPAQDELVAGLRETLAGKIRRDSIEVERFRKEFNWPRRAGQLATALDRLVAFPPRENPPGRPGQTAPAASVVITTRNRAESIRQSIRSALHQSVPVEVIVVDDGSTDGTAEMIRAEFPQVRLVRHDTSRGYIVRRNEAAEMASAKVIFSIDDDAIFSTARVVEQTLKEFDHPRIGAVAIPCADVRKSHALRQPVPVGEGCHVVDNFIGTAYAVQREVFLRVGGFRGELVHQGEERDFCLRLMNRGWVTRMGRADAIFHFESPNRDFRRMDFYGRRNDVLFAWHNVPRVVLPAHLVATTVNGICAGIEVRRPVRMFLGSLAGYFAIAQRWSERAPVTPPVYLLSRRLRKHGPARLDSVEPILPPMPQA